MFAASLNGSQLDAPMPTVYRARQRFPAPVEDDLEAAVRRELRPLEGRLAPGARIAITAGSRGVANIARILRAVGNEVRRYGGEPFVFPAMGSHGGATAEGQVTMLAELGVTDETVDMPIVSSMEVELIGRLENGLPVYLSRTALEADGIIPVGRVKPHTDFRADVESGLAKTCAIGMGKQKGAATIHSYGPEGLARWMPRAARLIVERAPVLLGLALVENAYHQTAIVRALPAEQIAGPGEAELLREARRLMPSIPFDDLDVLVVDEMGKNISGAGLDPNIIGRMMIRGVPEFERPRIANVAVLDLTEESHGNATGLGLADFTTQRLIDRMDWQASYLNSLTAGLNGVQRMQIPFVMPTDRAAVAMAIRTCGRADWENVRLVRIRNTLDLAEIYLSASLLDEARRNPALELEPRGAPLAFDQLGRILPFDDALAAAAPHLGARSADAWREDLEG